MAGSDGSKRGSVLLVGATGYIGQHIVRACLHFGHPTFLLVRPPQNVHKAQLLLSFKRAGAILVWASVEDSDALIDTMKKVDIVISCIAQNQLLEQLHLIDAAKKAGTIKRFLPSEFGMDPDRNLDCPPPVCDMFIQKRTVRRALEQSGIPYTYVSANCFNGYFLAGLFQLGRFFPPTDQVVIYGDGNVKGVYNREEDIASYVVRMIEDPRVANATVYIRPPRNILTANEMVSMWEECAGAVLKKSHLSEEELLKKFQDCEDYDFKVILGHVHLLYYVGCLCNFDVEPHQEASQLYPDVTCTSPRSYLQDFL